MFESKKVKWALIIIATFSLILGMVLSTFFDDIFSKSAVGQQDKEKQEKSKITASLESANRAFVQISKEVMPVVVSIYTEKKVKIGGREENPFGDDFFDDLFRDLPFRFRFEGPQGEIPQSGLGSGVIVRDNGYILTNNHVVQGADEINVKLSDNRKFKAKVVGRDEKSDVAVIKIEGDHLPVAKLGNSDKLEVGEWVLAVGSPFGLEQSVTAGIISAKGRNQVFGGDFYQDFIQTDAAINPGNSGGALVNIYGEVIGINTAIESRSGGYQGVGFAIPISMAKNIMQDLITKGKVVRAWLGVSIQDVDSDLAKKFNVNEISGALVAQVFKDSPADKAGLKTGDVIVEVNGKKVANRNQLMNEVAANEVNKEVAIKVIRDGKEKILRARLTERTEETVASARGGQSPRSWMGITIQQLTPELARRFDYDESEKGVIITEVKPGSAAHRKGLQRGDLITEMENREIKDLSDYSRVLNELGDTKKGILLLTKNRYGTRYVVLENGEE